MIESTDREATGELMKLRGIVDVLIPRGGAGLIQRCVRESLVPVIETGTGNCHIYVHESADFDKALNIIVNAKTQRVGVCNAAESLLVDRAVADAFLPAVVAVLHDHGVLIHGDEATCAACADAGLAEGDDYVAATEEDWGREYLALEMSVKVVANEDEAIAHINRYGTMHSEAIVAEDTDACERFLDEVDASAVYANASTRFTDGGEFGLGAEIGISTQKLHARGPFAAEALTTYKYKLRGTGQVRPYARANKNHHKGACPLCDGFGIKPERCRGRGRRTAWPLWCGQRARGAPSPTSRRPAKSRRASSRRQSACP